MTKTNNTEATLATAAKALAKAICKIGEVDQELADRLSAKLAAEISAYREAKRLDGYEVAREARMLAAG